jgi:hypothetical protein
MIQTHILLDPRSNLFKNLNKRGFITDDRKSIFIWLLSKPNIGELIEITSYSIKEKKFSTFLNNRNASIVVRILDLQQTHSHLKTDKIGIDLLVLKCVEDVSLNWL